MSVKIYYLENNGVPFYVGKTTRDNERNRLYAHRHSKQKQIDNLIVIDEVPESEWKFWESWYIYLFRSWGFNLENKNDGGGGPTYVSEERKIQIKNKLIGGKRTEETKQKMRKPKSSSVKGKKHGLYGKPKSEEHKKNKSIAAKKINGSPRNKAVEQLKNNKVINTFISAAEAERTIGKKGVKNVCNGKAKTCGGYEWRYK